MRRTTLKMILWLTIGFGILLAMSLSGCSDNVGPKSNRHITVDRIFVLTKYYAEYQLTTGMDGTSLTLLDTMGKYQVGDTLVLTKKTK